MRFAEVESELDTRSNYCACAVQFMIKTTLNEAERKAVAEAPALYSFDEQKMVNGLKNLCEGLSGGFSNNPNLESHCGLSYCALAALKLLGQKLEVHEYERTIDFLASRQQEGGF